MAVFIDINGHKWPHTGGVNATLPLHALQGIKRRFAMHPLKNGNATANRELLIR